MASQLTTILAIICIATHIKSAATTNFNCQILQEAFPQCECRAATEEKGAAYSIVDCSDRQLTQVPTIARAVGKPFYKLILKKNKITALTDASFQGLRIEYIDLSGNSLASVENNTFFSMKDDLLTLEIDGDSQSPPPTPALKVLNRVQSLTMRHYNVPVLEHTDKHFLSYAQLKSLTLDDWKIHHIEASAFVGLDRLESLALLNQEFSTMPIDAFRDDPFDNLETLRISYSEIKSVSHSVLSKLSKLKYLDLSSNQIEELEDGCFIDVGDTLQNIILKHNNLNNLNNDKEKLDGLNGMTALERLDFSSNTFQKIPKMPNLGVTKPFRLLLNENQISQVLDDSFAGYGAFLKDLDLRVNFIRKMDDQSLNGVTSLNSLYLQNQQGDDPMPLQLPQSLSQSASTIKTLNLSGQKVDPNSLWTVVKEMTSLQSLDLSSAELKSIPDNTFIKATALEHINLNTNQLSAITQRSLAGARSLKQLDLEGNSLTSIPSCLFYEFRSPQITLSLSLNPIICDCKITQLLEDIKNDRIVLKYNIFAPECKDGTALLSVKPENLVCNPTFEDPPCTEFYTTTTPITTAPVTDPSPSQLHLRVLDVGIKTIDVSWNLTDDTHLQKFQFIVTTSNGVEEFRRNNIAKSVRAMQATGLPSKSHITVCVYAVFSHGINSHACLRNKTGPISTPGKEGLENDDADSANTALIVGLVVGGVALIGIVIAIAILVVFRKKPKQVPADNYRAPTQPRSFAKAELPSMSDESRTFAKPKKNGKGQHPGNMQVVAISDGQTNPRHPGPRVGRVNMMFKPEDGYEHMSNIKKKNGGSMYENDHGALPPTPGPDQDSRPPSYPGATGGYYNQGYDEDKYDEIEVEI